MGCDSGGEPPSAKRFERRGLCLRSVVLNPTRFLCIQKLSLMRDPISCHASFRSCNATAHVSAQLWDSEISEDEKL